MAEITVPSLHEIQMQDVMVSTLDSESSDMSSSLSGTYDVF